MGVTLVCMHVFAIFTCFNLKLAGDNHEKHTKVTQEFIQSNGPSNTSNF